MEIKVNFLDKLRLEAKFDDFTVIADQPVRYKGDGSAPDEAPEESSEPAPAVAETSAEDTMKKAAPISQSELERFTTIDLKLLDNKAYFKSVFEKS